jgi:RNA polymerase primary sigma factor
MTQARKSQASAMDIYMTEMARYPLLSAEEEIELAEQCERGRTAERRLAEYPDLDDHERQRLETVADKGKRARQRLIQCNLRLVVSMAKRYARLGLPFGDLVQEGNVGLMNAVDRYDPQRQVRFATYAGWWIQQAIRRAISNQGRMVRLPTWMNGALYRLRQARSELQFDLKRRPTTQELAERMEMSPRRIRDLIKWDRRVLSLDTPVGDEGESELADFVPDRDTPPMEEICARRQLSENVQQVVTTRLPPREREILCMRFGLDGKGSQTLKQIADKLRLSRERVRQIEKRALRRLRRARTRHELRKAWGQS